MKNTLRDAASPQALNAADAAASATLAGKPASKSRTTPRDPKEDKHEQDRANLVEATDEAPIVLAEAAAVQAEEIALLTESAGAQAGAEAATAAQGVVASQGAVGGAAASTGTAGAAGAAISPTMIGAGVLGAVVVAAAAGGGGGGSSSNPAISSGDQPNAGAAQPQAPAAQDPAATEQQPGDAPAAPAETPTGVPVAQGEASAPKVAVHGVTKLQAESFAGSDADNAPEFIRIERIQSAFGLNHDARLIRYGNDDGADKTGVQGKATDNGTQATGTQSAAAQTAYEVVSFQDALTRTEAEALAKEMGGKLLVVDDASEASWLQANFRNLVGDQPAWIGSSKLEGQQAMDAVARSADASSLQFMDQDDAATLRAFIVEFNEYRSPLMLDGQPVQEGQIIARADFDKLSWDSTQNQRGVVSFVAVNSDDPETATVVSGAQTQTLTITDSPDVKPSVSPIDPGTSEDNPPPPPPSEDAPEAASTHPTYPDAHPDLSVAFDSIHKLDASLFTGENASKAPAYIRIVELYGASPVATDVSALRIERADGSKVNLVADQDQGSVVAAADFGNLVWDASLNTGGMFTFVALDENQAKIPEVPWQEVRIHEQPPAPVYQDNVKLGVQTDQVLNFDRSLFAGTEENRAPGRIKILSIDDGDNDSTTNPLKNSAEEASILRVNSVIQADDFGQISWDTAGASTGGTFSFVALDERGNHLGEEQTVTVYERGAAPEYAAQPEVLLKHDAAQSVIGAQVFNGTQAGNAPAWIRIVGNPVENDDTNADQSALHVLRSGTSEVRLTDGTLVSAQDFGQIRWDTAQNSGGSFSFEALDQHQNPFTPGQTVTVTINEQAAAPVYGFEGQQDIRVRSNGDSGQLEQYFIGSDAERKPANIRIDQIQENNDSDPDQGALFMLGDDGSRTAIKVDDVIKADQLDKLVWDSTQNEGGQIRFTALDANGAAYIDVPAQLLVLIEQQPI